MNIGIDMKGGDYAPLEVIKGIKEYVTSYTTHDFHLSLFGDVQELHSLIAEYRLPQDKLTVIHASQVIDMHEHPTKAFKEKPDSSILVGFQHLAAGSVDAFVSAGNTGAMLVGALFNLKAVEGILRPAISTIIPKQNGDTGILLDVGLNADCKAEQLNQFAVMGSVYAQNILDIENPKVGLINVGEEEGKGNMLTQSVYGLLKNNHAINFIGNVEGRDIFSDKADVVVCDGFTGNIILKMAESFYDISVKENLRSAYLNRFDFENIGGTPVLGVEKPVIIGHGISQSKAFCNMIEVARKMLNTDVLGKVKSAIKIS